MEKGIEVLEKFLKNGYKEMATQQYYSRQIEWGEGWVIIL